MKCLDMQYELGKKFSIPDDIQIEMCRIGYHACLKLEDILNYYCIEESRFFEVEVEDYITASSDSKIAARHITFIRELPFYEVLARLNFVKDGLSFWDAGIVNTNKGFLNTGNCNVGNYNVGCYNIGNYNVGCYNMGNYNEGNNNLGNDLIGNNLVAN